ncbi:putative hydrolase/N-acetyltransferase [Rubrivivax gelatinosus IL144]|uniref:Putative hydrolase/N-acetyltransferase n=1 Tax=Rubrivivax gelatinosus (strain NBRC 100245 / IL144) TaxID=983917 RepID=I0HSG5_RUBGI|nr:putative hydrolase/N-acetyltransferase [Rubrivivax gelatinosus IL144]
MNNLNRTDFRFSERLRVRWSEVDAQKVVFNAHYLSYFDTAIAGYWRALALPYEATLAALDGDLFVRKASLEYRSSARYDDLLDVGIRCRRIGNSSISFDAVAWRGATTVVAGELVYVFTDVAGQVPRPVPAALRTALERYEAGAPAVEVKVGRWAELGRDAQAIRSAVFVQEQGIPAELEWDAADAGAMHAVAINGVGAAVATGRWLDTDEPGVARIGRMAVLAPLRSGGVGRAVLDALVASAREAGREALMLHAQASAVAFYHRAGFEPVGPEFVEAGIPHQEMRRRL